MCFLVSDYVFISYFSKFCWRKYRLMHETGVRNRIKANFSEHDPCLFALVVDSGHFVSKELQNIGQAKHVIKFLVMTAFAFLFVNTLLSVQNDRGPQGTVSSILLPHPTLIRQLQGSSVVFCFQNHNLISVPYWHRWSLS